MANTRAMGATPQQEWIREAIDTSDYENVFSARIANNGTASVISKSADFIDSVVRTSSGTVTVNFKAGFFSVAPSVVSDINTTIIDRESVVTQISTTSVQVRTRVTHISNNFEDYPFQITVHRQGADVKNILV